MEVAGVDIILIGHNKQTKLSIVSFDLAMFLPNLNSESCVQFCFIK